VKKKQKFVVTHRIREEEEDEREKKDEQSKSVHIQFDQKCEMMMIEISITYVMKKVQGD